MKKFCFLLLSLVLVLSCRQGMEFDSSPRSNIEALWDIIDRRYCFLPYKAETIGLDWNRVREKYTAQVSPGMNSAQLFEVMSNMLAELQDGHVNLYYSADMSRYWSWHEDYPRNFDEDLRDRYLGKDYKIAAGLKYRILDDNTGYVVYESFSSGIGDGNIDEVLYYLRSCNGLILDIRGNGGGMLTNAERLTAHFTNQRTLVGYTMHKTGPGHNDFSTPQPEHITPSTGIRWQKPVVLLKELIRIFTDPGDVVIDPCAGSGTTLRAARELERNSYGFEVFKPFYEKAKAEMLKDDYSQLSFF